MTCGHYDRVRLLSGNRLLYSGGACVVDASQVPEKVLLRDRLFRGSGTGLLCTGELVRGAGTGPPCADKLVVLRGAGTGLPCLGELVVRGNKTGLLGIGELERGSGTGLACAGGFMVVADLPRGGKDGRGGR